MNRTELREILAGNPWFRGLPQMLAEGILSEGRVRWFEDQAIFRTGDEANGVFALLSGQIRISQTTSEGRAALLMVATPGAWFGESSMLDGKTRSTDAAAIGKTALLQIDRAGFARLTRNNPEHYAPFVQILGDRYRKALDHIVHTSGLPLAVRLAQRLGELGRGHGRKEGGGIVVDLRLSQEELAGTLGVSRQTVNKALKDFERKGLITVGYASTTLLKPSALEKLAKAEVSLPSDVG